MTNLVFYCLKLTVHLTYLSNYCVIIYYPDFRYKINNKRLHILAKQALISERLNKNGTIVEKFKEKKCLIFIA